MPTVSPYRSLPVDRRVGLVTQALASNSALRNGFIQRIVARGGGFRIATLKKWTPAQLAREVVRYNMETMQDEFSLMHALYVEQEPSLQIAFLEAAGVKHEGSSIPEDLAPPFADAGSVRKAALGLVKEYGDEAKRYLATIALYNTEAWPGLSELLTELQ